MEKFLIRYHITGNRVVTDIKEYENLGVAVAETSNRLRNERIGIVRNGSHVIEIKTEHITHHEVLTKKQADVDNHLSALANMLTNQK